MLPKEYLPTDAHAELRSAFEAVFDQPTVGAYNNGLLMILDAVSGRSILTSWEPLIGRGCTGLVTTAFGDIFFWNPSNGMNFLEVQRGEVEFIDPEVEWFLSDFLINPTVIESVLRAEQFERLVKKTRPLRYHEAFILEPWQLLGGQEKDENFTIGQCSTYLDLVGQTRFRK